MKKKVDKGIDVGGSMLPKIGLKVMGEGLLVKERAELEDAEVVTLEGLASKGPSLSFLGGTIKMGLNIEGAEDIAGAAAAEELAGGVLSIPNRTPCSGVGGGADKAWDLADVSA